MRSFFSFHLIGLIALAALCSDAGHAAPRKKAGPSRSHSSARQPKPKLPTAENYKGMACNGTGSTEFCMLCNVYFEARGEGYANKLAVARVVQTRVKKQRSTNACKVIYAPYQFSWTMAGTRHLPSPNDVDNFKALRDSLKAVREAMRTGASGFTHFYNPNIANPDWKSKCSRATTIGNHIFLRCLAEIDDLLQANAKTASARGDIIPPLWATSGSFSWLELLKPRENSLAPIGSGMNDSRYPYKSGASTNSGLDMPQTLELDGNGA